MAPSSASQPQWWFARTTEEECQLPGGCALEVNLTASPGCPSVQLGDAFMPHAVSALRGPGGLCARAARGTVAGAVCLRAREGEAVHSALGAACWKPRSGNWLQPSRHCS